MKGLRQKPAQQACFPYYPVDEAILVCIDLVENFVVAALGNTKG